MDVGIVSYGAYVPKYRIKPETIGDVWGVDGKSIGEGLYIKQKSVPGPDEDVVTIASEAARNMMLRVPEVNPKDIGAVYVGSESHPYAVKPTSTIVAEAIEATPAMTAADLEFACKAGTAAMQICIGMVLSGVIKYGVAIGADTSQGAPGDALEYSASAGGASYLIGTENVIARVNKTLSFTTDTPDFWRREGMPYPRHGGRFTGQPAYFRHITSVTKMMFEAMNSKPEDYKYAVFHQPNGKFPLRVATQLGFHPKQIEIGLLTPEIGNTYSGSVPLGLSAILDVAQPGDRIFVASYGSGAGSDSFDITVTDEMKRYRKENAPTMVKILKDPIFIDYARYAKFKEKIVMSRG